MLIILIDRWHVLSYLIRMPLLIQANHAIWQKSWSTSIVHTVFPLTLEVNASKEEKRACPFSSLSPRRKKTTKSFCKVWVSKLAESNFRENICSEDDLRSRVFGTFVVKFLACLPLLGFSNILKKGKIARLQRIFTLKRSPRIFGSLFSGWNFRTGKFWSL